MQIHYLEIVTREVDAVCSAYAAANGVQFGEPDAGFGNARTATLLGGGLVVVRAPMHETEEPVVRPYWLVDNIESAVGAYRPQRRLVTRGEFNTPIDRERRPTDRELHPRRTRSRC